jgi:hypothetical protein
MARLRCSLLPRSTARQAPSRVAESPGAWRRGDPRRHLLLEAYRELAGRSAAELPSVIAAFAASRQLPLTVHAATLRDTPNRGAVRVAHTLELTPPGLQCWRACWSDAAYRHPGEHLALLAAQLFSHREELSLLVARLEPLASGQESAGALVDAGTCARVAVAGYDVDSELLLGNPLLLLEAAGDLVHGGAGADAVGVATQNTEMNYLLLGLKWHAAVVD